MLGQTVENGSVHAELCAGGRKLPTQAGSDRAGSCRAFIRDGDFCGQTSALPVLGSWKKGLVALATSGTSVWLCGNSQTPLCLSL